MFVAIIAILVFHFGNEMATKNSPTLFYQDGGVITNYSVLLIYFPSLLSA